MQENIEDIIRKDAETSEREEKAHRDQVQYLQDLNADYKNELEELLHTAEVIKNHNCESLSFIKQIIN